jgi:N6-adenosine-specific RNA methylase IME4
MQRCGPSMRLEEQQYQIYNVKMVLSWIKDSQDGNIVSTAQGFAVDLVKERALELRRHDWLEDPWGYSA